MVLLRVSNNGGCLFRCSRESHITKYPPHITMALGDTGLLKCCSPNVCANWLLETWHRVESVSFAYVYACDGGDDGGEEENVKRCPHVPTAEIVLVFYFAHTHFPVPLSTFCISRPSLAFRSLCLKYVFWRLHSG